MNIWLCLPTANPTLSAKTLPAWREHGCKIAALVDGDYTPPAPVDHLVRVDKYPGWANADNLLTRIALDLGADIVVCAGDDHWPDPTHTAGDIGRELMDAADDEGLGVLQPSGDLCGVNPKGFGGRHHCSSSWFTSEYVRRINRGNGLFWPEYRHLYADTEAYEVANMIGCYHDCPQFSQRHDHAQRIGGKGTPGPRQSGKANDGGLYRRRKKMRFPGHELLDGDAT